MISNTDYSTDTSSDATDSRGTIYIEPTEIYIEYETNPCSGYADYFSPDWARIERDHLNAIGRAAFNKKPINQPQHHPRPEITRRMMRCNLDRRD